MNMWSEGAMNERIAEAKAEAERNRAMQLVGFSIFDVKAGAYTPPFFVRSAAEGARTFWDLVNDQSTPFYRHPDDYRLFKVGYFNQGTAEWTPLSNGAELWEEGSAVKSRDVEQKGRVG